MDAGEQNAAWLREVSADIQPGPDGRGRVLGAARKRELMLRHINETPGACRWCLCRLAGWGVNWTHTLCAACVPFDHQVNSAIRRTREYEHQQLIEEASALDALRTHLRDAR